MQNVKSYLALGTDKEYARVKREGFLFSLINHFDSENVLPDEADGVQGFEKKHLLMVQKRRLRNEIFREANKLAKKYNETHQTSVSPDDYQVLIHAFFNTSYGKKFASMKNAWCGYGSSKTAQTQAARNAGLANDVKFGEALNLIDSVESLIENDDIPISPYDPSFASSDAFDGEDRDVLGHFYPNATIGDNDEIRQIHVGSMTYDAEGPLVRSGYAQLDHFISSKKDKTAVKDFLMLNVENISTEERDFMVDACRYLSSIGMDYSIRVRNLATDENGAPVPKTGEICLTTASGVDIRLFDAKDGAQYAGRMYTNGRPIYLSFYGGSNDGQRNASNSRFITNEDRLNLLKWYLGGESIIVAERDANGHTRPKSDYKVIGKSNTPVIGENRVLLNTGLSSGTRENKLTRLSTTYRAKNGASRSGSGGNSGVTFAYIDGIKPVLITAQIAASSSTKYKSAEMQFMRSIYIPTGDAITNPASATHANWANYFAELSEDEVIPSDIAGRTEDGKLIVTDNVPTSHVRYYQHLSVRNTLNNWVESAREHHRELVNIDDIMANYEIYLKDKNHELPTTGDDNIDELRERYWNVLTGKSSEEDLKAFFDATEESDEIDEDAIEDSGLVANKKAYTDGLDLSVLTGGTVEEKLAFIKAHYQNYLDIEIGNTPKLAFPGQTVDNSGRGFNPEKVARYSVVEKSNGIQKNYDYIRHMLSRLGDDYDSSWISSDNYISNQIKNDLIRYDANKVLATFTYKQLADGADGVSAAEKSDFGKSNPVMTSMMKHTAQVLMSSGCNPNTIEISIDENGIMQYKGTQAGSRFSASTADGDAKAIPVRGHLGQIFEPDRYGVIDPKYAVDTDSVFVPGYNAYLVENDPENPQELRDRLRLVGWEQQMKSAITQEIRNACFNVADEYNFTPHTASLNRVYRKAYDTRFTREHYYSHLPQAGKKITDEQRTFLNTIETLKGRCRFPNAYDKGATTEAQSYLEHPDREESQRYDFYYSDLCDNENLRVLGEFFDGIFDPDMTGTARTQGIVRYLAEGASVDSTTGKVTGVAYRGNNAPKCALMNDKLFRNKDFDTWDRREMAASQVLTAWHTPRHVGTAMMTIDGWTFDDGFVVSKKFAEKYAVKDPKGNMRPLMAQDKLSDMHGNKGVIGLVVDPELASDNIMQKFSDEYFPELDISIDTFYEGLEAFESNIENHPADVAFKMADGENPDVQYSVKFDDSLPESRRMQAAKAIQNGNVIRELARVTGELISVGKPFNINYAGKTYSVTLDGKSNDSYLQQIAYAIQDAQGVKGLDDVMHLFRDNENLDVVMAPYSGMSRFNGGSVVSLMEETAPLKIGDKVVDGGMGYTDLIVVDMLADVKSHFYGEKELREGKGRKASGQLAWALQAKGAYAILNEFYGKNGKAFDNLREYALSIGLDLNEQLEPVIGYHEQTDRGEKRKLIKLPKNGEVTYKEVSINNTKPKTFAYYLDEKYNEAMSDALLTELNQSGGFMELPFQLDFRTLDYVRGIFNTKAVSDDAFKLKPTGQTFVDVDGKIKPTYGLPILSAGLRSGQDFQDGTSKPHDYTKMYAEIYRQATFYSGCQAEIEKLDKMIASADTAASKADLAARKDALLKGRETCQKTAQAQFDEIVRDIIDKRFDNKHNVIRDEVMTKRMDHSATAVWSADPRLNLNEVSMSIENAEKMGLIKKNSEGEYPKDDKGNYVLDQNRILLFRDPILHTGCIRYLNVVIDNRNLKGVCVNPLIDKSFDGDFDGDSVGMKTLQSTSAISQAHTCFSLETNLLDYNTKVTITNPETGEEKEGYDIYIQSGLDRASNEYLHPELKKQIDMLRWNINTVEDTYKKILSGELPESALSCQGPSSRGWVTKTGKAALNQLRKQYVNELNDWAHHVLDGIGSDHMVLKDAKTVAASMQHMVDNKSKGSQSKMRDFAHNLGMKYDESEKDGRVDLNTVEFITDSKGNRCSMSVAEGNNRETDKAIQETAAYKADNTQLGGTAAQRGVAAFRDVAISETLYLTYPVTQAILQSKHDPKDAKIKDEIVRFWGVDVWNGYKLTGDWSADRSPEELQEQAHNKVKEFVLDEYGEKIPVKDKDGNVRTDADGNTIYEQTYVKCTRDEWIAQMKGMFKALKVDVNEDYIHELANVMSNQEPAPVPSAVTGFNVSYEDRSKNRVVVRAGKSDEVIGVDDYMKRHGSLLDKMAYFGKAGAFIQQALQTDVAYKKMLDDFAMTPKDSESKTTSALMGDVVSFAINYHESDPKHKAAERAKLPNSATFIPNSVVDEVYGDNYRVTENTDMNVFIGKNGAEIEKTPNPLGRSDCRLSKTDLETTCQAYMGESQKDYEARVISYNKAKAALEEKAKQQAAMADQEIHVSEATDEDTLDSVKFG